MHRIDPLSHGSGVAGPISRYGVKLSSVREEESTSHGIFRISIVHEMVGIHRYKLALLPDVVHQAHPKC